MRTKNPTSQRVQVALRRLLEAGFALILGNLVAALRPTTGVWLLGSVAILYALTYAWDWTSGFYRRGLVVACALGSLFCVFKAYRDYIGANYRLTYRICGASVPNASYRLAGAKLHIQIGNPGPEKLTYAIKDHYHSFDGVVSRQPYLDNKQDVARDADMPLWGSHPGWEDVAVLKMPETPSPGQLRGEYRFKLKFGPDPEDPTQTAEILGNYYITFDATGQPVGTADFKPLADKNITFISDPCELELSA